MGPRGVPELGNTLNVGRPGYDMPLIVLAAVSGTRILTPAQHLKFDRLPADSSSATRAARRPKAILPASASPRTDTQMARVVSDMPRLSEPYETSLCSSPRSVIAEFPATFAANFIG
jgi:hypothetical protein